MAYIVPTIEPLEIVAGETAQWTRLFFDYPASSGGTLKYVFAGPSVQQITATSDGDTWAVTLTAAQTAALAPGAYSWAAYHVSDDGGTEIVRRAATDGTAEGTLVVRQGLLTAQPGDLVDEAVKELTLIEARIKELLADNLASYSVGGQTAQKRELTELQVQAGILRARIWRNRNPESAFPEYEVRHVAAI